MPELDGKICIKVTESKKAILSLKYTFTEDVNVFFFFFQLLSSFFFFFLSLLKSAEFNEMCPRGKGFVPSGESSYEVGGENYKGQNPAVMNLQRLCMPDIQGKAWLGLDSIEFC